METELTEALLDLSIPITEIIGGGGGEAKVTDRLKRKLWAAGWPKTIITIRKIINGVERESVTHEIDHVRTFQEGTAALEIEWNNKDPFFDRDLENFKRLHGEGAFSVGIIVTRGESFQSEIRSLVLRYARERNVSDFGQFPAELRYRPSERFREEVTELVRKGRPFPQVWAERFCSDKYGQSTTHWKKLEARVSRGVGNPCPLLMIGIPSCVVRF